MSAVAAAATRSPGHLRVDGDASQNTFPSEKTPRNERLSPLYRCAKSGCSGSWHWDGPATEPVRCPQCSALNCLACRAIHVGLSCEQHIASLVRAMDSGALEVDTPQLTVVHLGLLTCRKENDVQFVVCYDPSAVHSSSSEDMKTKSRSGLLYVTRRQGEDSKEKKKRLQEQLELYTKDIVANSAPFTCPVCKSDVAKGDGVCLKSCHHTLCRGCVLGAIDRSGTVAVKCPYSENSITCDIDIQDTEVRALLTKEEYEEYLLKGLLEVKVSAKNFFHCKTADCPWWCFIEASVPEVECKVCGTKNCVNCDAIHLGMTCAEYQAWQASMKQLVPIRCANDMDNLLAFMLHVAYMACIVYLLVKCIFP